MKRDRALEILRAANEKRAVQIDFPLVIDGIEIPVTMKNIDVIDVSMMQQMTIEKALNEARQEGLHLLPVNEKRWETHLKRATENLEGSVKKEVLRRLEKEKPQTLADQIAIEASWYYTGRKYIPKILYVGDSLLFDESNIEDYYQLVRDMDALTLLVNKFSELMTRQREIEQSVKNLKATPSLN